MGVYDAGHLSVDAFLDAFDPPLRPETVLRMEVNLHLPAPGDSAALYVALRVGTERLYVVRSMSAFLRAFAKGEHLAFGKGLRSIRSQCALRGRTSASWRCCKRLPPPWNARSRSGASRRWRRAQENSCRLASYRRGVCCDC